MALIGQKNLAESTAESFESEASAKVQPKLKLVQGGAAQAQTSNPGKRPNVFDYHDSKIFLRDWCDYQKSVDANFSVRNLSVAAGFSSNGYLSKVLSGARGLSAKALIKMGEHLKLSSEELGYLELLRAVSESRIPVDREKALKRLKGFSSYKQMGESETEVYLYLSHWYLVAIREMAHLQDFKFDAHWIQKRLRNELSIESVSEAMQFLLHYGYWEKTAAGSVSVKEKDINCIDGVYRIALARFYSEMLDLAKRSFDNAPRTQRYIRGYTATIPKAQLKKIKQIMDDAHAAIKTVLGDVQVQGEETYQITFCAFPLTKSAGEEL